MVRNLTVKILSAAMLIGLTQVAFGQRSPIQYFRPYDQGGINVFETSKDDSTEFEGLALRIGANFTQQYQNLSHSNKARAILTPVTVTTPALPRLRETVAGSGIFETYPANGNPGVVQEGIRTADGVYAGYLNANNQLYTNSTALYELAPGFNLAMANLNIDVQLADGVRVSLVSYMSSKHHNEFWVKGGYFQIDKVSFLNNAFLDQLWKNLTLKIGHMEINYGDAHFRRSDGGNALYNPFVENNIMDAFSTEIGAELYWQKNGLIAMLGVTDGEIQGSVTKPNDRSPSIYGKLGIDKNLGDQKRVRLTGSVYTTKSSVSNTLFAGDRTGSHYYFVMEPTTATLTGNYASGRLNPNLRDNVTAIMINPFVKFKGLELFGTYEIAKGSTALERGEVQNPNPGIARLAKQDDRKFNQLAVDVLYRFANDKLYVGGKYNKVEGTMVFDQNAATYAQGTRQDISIDRTSLGAGWFITRNVLFKAEYVSQKYNDFPTEDLRSGGKFSGWLVEGIIGF
jgi:hypothetical protein